MRLYSPYLHNVYNTENYNNLVTRVQQNVLMLKEELKFDAIAFRGTSGAALAYPVSFLTGIPLMSARKAGENAHTSSKVEGFTEYENCKPIRKYAIIDDLISSGATCQGIVQSVNAYCSERNEKPPACVGIMLYNSEQGWRATVEDIPVFKV